MRPVNLIPPEERRGSSAPTRTGRTPYVLLGVMALVVAGFALVTVTNKSIAEKESEISRLQVEETDARAQAEALRPFAEFAAAREMRTATVDSLARSRFDWERVLNELSRVVPDDIWLIELAGSVSPAVQLGDAPNISIRGDVPGPALEIVGCGRTHESVAGLLAALRDIDGVTRVTAASAERPDAEDADQADASAIGASDSDCRTRDHVSQFEIVAAFDEVGVPDVTGSAPAPAPEGESDATPSDEGGVTPASAGGSS